MKEQQHEMMDSDCNWWTINMTQHDGGQVEFYITSGGIRQDLYPPDVATKALKMWSQWAMQF